VTRNIVWFRRDLRISDNPALVEAINSSEEIITLFILDPSLINQSGSKRLAYLAQSLRALDASLGGSLHVMVGDQVEVIKDLQKRYDAKQVHISTEYEPYGAARDARVESAGIELVRTGSPYAVAPGRVLKPSDATPYKVYTPFYRAWLAHGWRKPAAKPSEIPAVKPKSDDRSFPDWSCDVDIIAAGEEAALERWSIFQENGLDFYDERRNMPGIDGTSKLSTYLKFGEIHPRTLLQNLGTSAAHETFKKEIAWREFYADVLFNNPHTENDYYAPQYKNMNYNSPGAQLQAWKEGKTGFPYVDAAMRQLVQEGWMHNRTRMIVASFLVKDLHLEWQHGADFFKEHLIDYDVASNAHGWQWTAGTGTDASPYYRVFNPIEQGKKFDPPGDYIRKYIPELAHLTSEEIHEPWLAPQGYTHGYPKQIVNHAIERVESLERLKALKDALQK
jgi:deoxyribodipyrimidine photo-lyase